MKCLDAWNRVIVVACGSAIAIAVCGASTYVDAQTSSRFVSPLASEAAAARAQPTKPDPNARITLVLHDSTVDYALHAIAQQVHLRLVYDNSDPLTRKRITINLTNVSATEALAAVLKGTGFTAKFAPDGETVVIRQQGESSSSEHTRAPSGVIAGRVTDSASEKGVSGATVALQGTKLSTLTSGAGDFVLRDVPPGKQLLTVKSFGYKPASRDLTVEDSAHVTLHIVLVPAATMLSELVTTATGVQRALEVGNDVTIINVDSVKRTAPINSVTDLLENRVPGLTVVHTDGTPGDPSRLLLRGAGSVLGANNPIVVVDGIRVYYPQDLGSVQQQVKAGAGSATYGYARPSPLDQIDPNTIATIEVLKGPSASALYGSDAANGAIVITTKKGEPGQTRWNVSADQGVSYLPGAYPENTFQFGHGDSQSNLGYGVGDGFCIGGLEEGGGSYPIPCDIDSTVTYQALNDPRFSPLTHGVFSTASVTVSGGAPALTYSFTGSGSDTHGMTKLPTAYAQNYQTVVGTSPPTWMAHPDDYLIWNMGGQITAALSPTAHLTVSDMLSNSTQHRTNLGLTAINTLIGAYVDTSNVANIPGYQGFLNQVTQATITSTASAALQWQVRPWLPLSITAGLNQTSETDKDYLPAGLPAAEYLSASDTTGGYTLGHGQASVVTLNANTTVQMPLPRGMQARVAFGTNFVNQTTTAQNIATSNIPVGVSDPTTFVQTTATSVVQQTQSAATYGWYVEPQLQPWPKLFFQPGFRLDGGTSSGTRAGLTAFPKVSLSYVAIDPSDGQRKGRWTSWLTLLRPFGSFGIAGVQPQPGQNLRLFTAPQLISLDGGTVESTEDVLQTLGNTILHPQRSRELELGFDADAFQERVTLRVTYHNKLTLDDIESIPVALSVAGDVANSEFVNIGNIRNTGLDFTAHVQVLQSKFASWGLGGSISTNDNQVISTSSTYSQLSSCLGAGFVPCARVGYPLGAVFIHSIVGYADANGDGNIEPNEIQYSDSGVYAGSPDPRYSATFSTDVRFWNGRLSVNADGSYLNGLEISNQLITETIESAANAPDANLYEKALGTIAMGGQAGVSSGVTYAQVNELRFNSVSATWILPNAMAHVFRGHQASLALQGSNLGLWTNYRGKDPSVNASVSGFQVVDTGELPQPRTWRLSVRVDQ